MSQWCIFRPFCCRPRAALWWVIHWLRESSILLVLLQLSRSGGFSTLHDVLVWWSYRSLVAVVGHVICRTVWTGGNTWNTNPYEVPVIITGLQKYYFVFLCVSMEMATRVNLNKWVNKSGEDQDSGGQEISRPWVVDQITDLFRTTHTVKTKQVSKSRGQWCGDIELAGYLANTVGPVPLVLDLRISHDRWGSSSDPSINGHLHLP